YSELGILGTSLGSCYAFLASAHDPRIKVSAFNHASTYFADVVWTGQATRHVRRGLEEDIDLERLRQLWLAISPIAYFDKFARSSCPEAAPCSRSSHHWVPAAAFAGVQILTPGRCLRPAPAQSPRSEFRRRRTAACLCDRSALHRSVKACRRSAARGIARSAD